MSQLIRHLRLGTTAHALRRIWIGLVVGGLAVGLSCSIASAQGQTVDGKANKTDQPACEGLLAQATPVPFADFVIQLVRAGGNIHVLVDGLEDRFGGPNFRISVPFSRRRVLIFQERPPIVTIMNEHARLPYVNKNFDLSHGHFNSINSVDTVDELWRDLHGELQDIFMNEKIGAIMDKHKTVLFGPAADVLPPPAEAPAFSDSITFNLNQKLEDYFLRVWAEYCFGDVDIQKFTETRRRLVNVLEIVFHKNRFNRLPIIGRLTSTRNRARHADELAAVDHELAEILRQSIAQRKGAFYQLYERLASKYENAFEITLDNSFLGILVYDFIYIVTLDALARVAKDPSLRLGEQFRSSRHNAFLYPFRFREIAADFSDLRAGDLCILNLQKSGLYFSSGPRACVGARLFSEITRKLTDYFNDQELCFTDPNEEITTTGNRDLPFMTSRHDVHLTPKRCPFSHAHAAANHDSQFPSPSFSEKDASQ